MQTLVHKYKQANSKRGVDNEKRKTTENLAKKTKETESTHFTYQARSNLNVYEQYERYT